MTSWLTLVSRRGEPSRRVRRVTVVIAVVGIPAVVFVLARVSRAHWPMPVWLLALVVLLAAISLPLLVLSEFRRNIFRRGLPDEREQRRRDEAYRVSYRIVEVGVVLGLPVAALALLGGLQRPIASDDLFSLWMTVWGWVVFLPYAVFAWREPDAPA